MRQTTFATVGLPAIDCTCTVTYSLLEDASPTKSNAFPVYGVAAELCCQNTRLDYAAVTDITPSADTVMRLLYLLRSHTVTPTTLREVVEDFIVERL